MKLDALAGPWRSQSAVTQVGPSSIAIDDLPSSLNGLRKVSRQLVTHYMGSNDGVSGPITGERLKEVDARYADAMFSRLLEIGPRNLSGERPLDERIAGCCRDFAVLYVAMARHKGIPARVRVGYATYFKPGWYIDHVIAEAWDAGDKRWRLIEPEISDDLATNAKFDPLDVSPDRFVTGPRAWVAARSGQIDPERCVVAPDLKVSYTRGWLSLRHHVVQDLAALNKAEMLVWDQWGVLDDDDPLRHAEMLDRLAWDTSDSNCTVADLSKWSNEKGIRIPTEVTSYSPAYSSPLKVDVSRVLDGMIRL